MLSLIFSIEGDEIHGNMHKCGKTYFKFTESLQITTVMEICIQFSRPSLSFLTFPIS